MVGLKGGQVSRNFNLPFDPHKSKYLSCYLNFACGGSNVILIIVIQFVKLKRYSIFNVSLIDSERT